MRYEFQPLLNWTDPVTDPRPACRFRASWSDTLELLSTETAYLTAPLVVLQVDVPDGRIRRDGMLYATARAGFPGVRVSFTSLYGPLTYSTDRFGDWQDNIRAIALSLSALRAVDRYGVNRSGEQYTGWLAIGAAPAPDPVAEARALIESYGGDKAAVKATHPDFGGDPAKFIAVQAARKLLAGVA